MPGWTNDDSIFLALSERLHHHLALLQVIARTKRDVRHAYYTGFLLRLDPDLFWVTAAHCIEEVVALRAASQELHTHLLDARERREPPMPFPLFEQLLAYPTSDVRDVAVARLEGNCRDLVEANPSAVPLSEQALSGCEVVPGASLCLTGVPLELSREIRHEQERGVSVGMAAAPVCVRVDVRPAEQRPEDDPAFWNHPHCLYHEVALPTGSPVQRIESVKGMSGGPVYSLEETKPGVLRYRLVGIQSAWLRGRSVLRIEPTRALLTLIEFLRDEKYPRPTGA